MQEATLDTATLDWLTDRILDALERVVAGAYRPGQGVEAAPFGLALAEWLNLQ